MLIVTLALCDSNSLSLFLAQTGPEDRIKELAPTLVKLDRNDEVLPHDNPLSLACDQESGEFFHLKIERT